MYRTSKQGEQQGEQPTTNKTKTAPLRERRALTCHGVRREPDTCKIKNSMKGGGDHVTHDEQIRQIARQRKNKDRQFLS